MWIMLIMQIGYLQLVRVGGKDCDEYVCNADNLNYVDCVKSTVIRTISIAPTIHGMYKM
jgi:hypothetical protein